MRRVPSAPRRLIRRVGVALVALALIGSANLWRQAPAVAQDEQALVARGGELYTLECALCHGVDGVGIERSGATGGPSLVGVGAASVDFMLRTGRMPATDQRDRLLRRAPKFGLDDRRALIAYVTSLAPGEGPAVPDVDGWSSADLARGLQAFTTNCAACHGPTAAGVAVGQRDVSSSLDVAAPVEVAEAIRTGPGVMPVFGEDVFDQGTLEAVVGWVMHLRDREAPGGMALGRSGPVSEGVVAWIVGMGLLGVVMYLLGEKSGDERDADAV